MPGRPTAVVFVGDYRGPTVTRYEAVMSEAKRKVCVCVGGGGLPFSGNSSITL